MTVDERKAFEDLRTYAITWGEQLGQAKVYQVETLRIVNAVLKDDPLPRFEDVRGILEESKPEAAKGETCGTCRFYRFHSTGTNTINLYFCRCPPYPERAVFVRRNQPACEYWEPIPPQPDKAPSPQVSDEEWAEEMAETMVNHQEEVGGALCRDEIAIIILKALQTRKVEK